MIWKNFHSFRGECLEEVLEWYLSVIGNRKVGNGRPIFVLSELFSLIESQFVTSSLCRFFFYNERVSPYCQDLFYRITFELDRFLSHQWIIDLFIRSRMSDLNCLTVMTMMIMFLSAGRENNLRFCLEDRRESLLILSRSFSMRK